MSKMKSKRRSPPPAARRSRQMVGDSMVNLLTGMGTARDKTAHTRYAPHVVNNADTYEGSALARRIVDLLGEDATREWRSWQGDNDQIGALEATEDRLGIPAKVEEAIHLARLTGGSALLIGADTGRQAEPLDPERVRRDGLEYVTVLSRFDLNATVIETDVASPYFGLPAYYTLSKDPTVRIHPSRLAIFRGPRRARGFQAVGAARDPWGQPVLEAVYAHLTGCESAIQNTVTLLFDQTVDVFKIPHYAEGYAQDGQTYLNDVEARVALAHGMKSVIKALVLDSEEDYERKGASFSGIADIIDRTQQFLCAATGYPVTVLFGRSPGGLNATGDNDTRMYYDRVRAFQSREVGSALAILDECLIRSALGSRPPEVFYTWASLWQRTATENAELAAKTATTIKTLADARVFGAEVLARAGAAALVESGAMPGFEQAIDEADDSDGDPPDDEQALRPGENADLDDARVAPLYVSRKVLNAEQILRWAAEQGITPLEPMSELHVTVLSSRAPVDWLKAPPDWDSDELIIEAGGARVLERFGENRDKAVLGFRNHALEYRHSQLREIGGSHDWAEYTPHITLAVGIDPELDIDSMQPYTGPIRLGPEIFRKWEP